MMRIPDDVIGPAFHETMKQFKRNPERWMAEEAQVLGKHLGTDYGHIPDRELKDAAITFRKKENGKGYILWCQLNEVEPVQAGRKKKMREKRKLKPVTKRKISPELEAHYKSDFFHAVKAEEIRKHPICRICTMKRSETIHHSDYDHIGTIAELDDVIAVCNVCHEMAEERKEYEREEKRKLGLSGAEVNGACQHC